jgi:hypothetical protein
MIYLHIAQCDLVKAHSPLDTLYNYPKKKKDKPDTSENEGKI